MTALEAVFWLALVCAPYVVLRVRRRLVINKLYWREVDAYREFLVFKTSVDGYNTRALWDSARKRLRAAKSAPLWRWTP